MAATIDALGRDLVARGWMVPARQQDRMPWYCLPGWLVAVWCLLQFLLTLPHFAEPGRSMQALGRWGCSALVSSSQ